MNRAPRTPNGALCGIVRHAEPSREQQAEAAKLDAAILANLKELGYVG